MAWLWNHHLLACLLITLVCCPSWTVVDADQQIADNYNNLLVDLRGQVSHSYRDNTRIMTGGRENSFLSMAPLADDPTSVELIISHRDLYVLGYRVTRDGIRIVYVFDDTNQNEIDKSDYNRLETLSFGGGYPSLVPAAGLKKREGLPVNPGMLNRGIMVLGQEMKKDSQQRAKILLGLVMIISEAARFNDIFNTVRDSLHDDVDWHATDRQTGIMNSWGQLSQFIIDHVHDTTETATQYFPKFRETLTLREALDLCAVIKRLHLSGENSNTTNNAGMKLLALAYACLQILACLQYYNNVGRMVQVLVANTNVGNGPRSKKQMLTTEKF